MSTNLITSPVAGGDDALASQYNNLRKDVLQNAGDYSASAGSANAYTLAIDSVITAYDEGQVFKFKANFSNTGPATLDVNSIGAVTIKKNTTDDLRSGDIVNGQVVFVVYDGTNFQMISVDSNINNINLNQKKSFILGENMVAGNAAIIGGGIAYAFATQSTRNSTTPTAPTSWSGQTFLTRSNAQFLTKITLYLTDAGLGGKTFTLDVYATSAGKPTGASLGTATVASTGSLSSTARDFTFSSPIAISGSTTYCFVVTSDSNSLTMDAQNSGNPYSGGTMITTTDSGANWTIETDKDVKFIIYTVDTVSGRAYKASSLLNSEFANAFIGFLSENGSAGETKLFNIGGVDNNQSSLTVGNTYYLADTVGTIANSAGSQSRKIGLAISATADVPNAQ